MNDRRRARILALQALCQLEVLDEDFLSQIDDFLADENPPERVRTHARELITETRAHRELIDARIQTVAENWELQRMAPIDRNILRLAVCELYYRPDVPPKVAVNEAVELGKAFCTAESPGFINGVLDKIAKELKQEPNTHRLETGATDSDDCMSENNAHGTL